MFVADENLRNRASIAARNHFLAELEVILDIDFAQVRIFLGQEIAGASAVWTPIRDVHGHGGPRHLLFAKGRLSFTQAFKPP